MQLQQYHLEDERRRDELDDINEQQSTSIGKKSKPRYFTWLCI